MCPSFWLIFEKEKEKERREKEKEEEKKGLLKDTLLCFMDVIIIITRVYYSGLFRV